MSRMASAILLVTSSIRFSVCPATRVCQILLTTPVSATFIASFLPASHSWRHLRILLNAAGEHQVDPGH